MSSNFYEWAQLNAATVDDVTRSDILDKTLIWLVGHDHPSVTVTAPNGGETLTREHGVDRLDRDHGHRVHRGFPADLL